MRGHHARHLGQRVCAEVHAVAGLRQRIPDLPRRRVPELHLRVGPESHRDQGPVGGKGEGHRRCADLPPSLAARAAEDKLAVGREANPRLRRENRMGRAVRRPALPGFLAGGPIPDTHRVTVAVRVQRLAIVGEGQGRDRPPMPVVCPRDFPARVDLELACRFAAQATDQRLAVGREGQCRTDVGARRVGTPQFELGLGWLTEGVGAFARRQVP